MSPARAQTSASIGAGASVVRYDGFLASGAASITPAISFDRRNVSLGGQGSWTVFESGNQVFQASAAAAWRAPAGTRWRFELAGAAGASQYAGEATAGHILARSRLHFGAGKRGGWLGASTGASFDGSADVPLELAIGVWSVRGQFGLVGTVTGAWLADEHYVDLTTSAALKLGRVDIDAQLGARPVAEINDDATVPTSEVWGEISALVGITSHVALMLSGGNYPSDPVRRLLGARYATAGLQFTTAGAARPGPVPIAAITPPANNASAPRLELETAGPMQTLRIRAAAAQSVEVAGDFTDWQPLPLVRARDDSWEIQIALEPGVHRLNIRLDGGAWLVPAGARSEVDEFGSMVGVVVVH